ncbi:Destabilase [Meloidogyne graminicola]|uniref:lysozyme n=1 Tax=Meloidogyne graminicola TaxID=189291 RepID=A0A8S9ZM60_9BILA|nr:Destabilase [Meloidogyne graminicola]
MKILNLLIVFIILSIAIIQPVVAPTPQEILAEIQAAASKGNKLIIYYISSGGSSVDGETVTKKKYIGFLPETQKFFSRAVNGIYEMKKKFLRLITLTNCLSCICQHESNCQPLLVNGMMMLLVVDIFSINKGLISIGKLKIKLNYYTDCSAPGRGDDEDIETAWQRCALDYNCSIQCIMLIWIRYLSLCDKTRCVSTCEKVWIHNGGPYGCSAQKN